MPQKFLGQKNFSSLQVFDVNYPANRLTRPHFDRENRISIVLRGSLKEVACGQETFAGTGSVVFKPGDMVHQNTYGPTGTRIVSVVFKNHPSPQLPPLNINQWQWLHGLPLATSAFQFAQKLSTISSEEDLYEEVVNFFVQAPGEAPQTTAAQPLWLQRIAEKIRDEFDQLIRTKDLAQEVGVHPVYLARIFRKYYGCSIKSYLQKLRIERAIQELSEQKKSVVDIALDAGFSDQSHLSRIFKRDLEMSPAAFRKWLRHYELTLQ